MDFIHVTRCNIEEFYLVNRVCVPNIEFTKKIILIFLIVHVMNTILQNVCLLPRN